MSAAKKRLFLAAAALPLLSMLIIGSARGQFRPPGQLPGQNFPRPPGINIPRPPGLNPGGLNPGGLNPGGLNPGGLNPGGFNPGGLNPGGLNPGGFPKTPRIDIPRFEKVWECSGCGANLGNGAFPISPCPGCKARIINGIGGGAINRGNSPPPGINIPNRPGNTQVPAPNPFVQNTSTRPAAGASEGSSAAKVFYIIGAVIGLAMLITGTITAVKCA